MRSIIALAALPLIAPLAAHAAPADFSACDGYSAPGKKSDGITKGTWLWGLATATADFRKGSVALGRRGVEACDAALADPLLLPEFWLRRAHLLQSKALHQMSVKADTDALATLDQSDAVGAAHADPWFDNSIRLANRALRAIAYYRLDRKDDAHAALKAVIAARPWSISLRRLADSIRTSFEPDLDTHLALLREEAVLEPRKLHLLFWLSLSQGRFDDAVAYSRQLSFDIPRKRGEWATEGAETRSYELIRERASVAGATAYALAATSDLEASAHAYQNGLADIVEATMPPEPDSRGRPPGKRAMRDYAQRKAAGEQARAALEDWGRAIALRRAAATMTLEQLDTATDRPHAEGLMVAADFFRQIKPADLKQADRINAAIDMLQQNQDRARRKAIQLNFNALVKLLPRPEKASMLPKMEHEGGDIFKSSLNGYAVRKADDPALVNVRFGHAVASSALTEEAAFLAAANHVASLGKDAFIVDASQLIVRTTYVSGMYVRSSSNPSGYELRLLLRPVDSAALPKELEGERWRLIKVRDVQVALAAKFPRQP